MRLTYRWLLHEDNHGPQQSKWVANRHRRRSRPTWISKFTFLTAILWFSDPSSGFKTLSHSAGSPYLQWLAKICPWFQCRRRGPLRGSSNATRPWRTASVRFLSLYSHLLLAYLTCSWEAWWQHVYSYQQIQTVLLALWRFKHAKAAKRPPILCDSPWF